jgi:hypothetical protein
VIAAKELQVQYEKGKRLMAASQRNRLVRYYPHSNKMARGILVLSLRRT